MAPSTPLAVPSDDAGRRRALGLDLGERRIGVAVSDSAGKLATPIEVVSRSGRRADDHAAIARLVAEWEVDVVVVGVPYGLDGSIGPSARKMIAEADRLGDVLPVPVETYDERFTTVTAERALMHQDMNARDRRHVVDMVAAAVMLQAWLDGLTSR